MVSLWTNISQRCSFSKRSKHSLEPPSGTGTYFETVMALDTRVWNYHQTWYIIKCMFKGVSFSIVSFPHLYICFEKMIGNFPRVAGYQQKVRWAEQPEEVLLNTGADLPLGREDGDFGHVGRTLWQAVDRRRGKGDPLDWIFLSSWLLANCWNNIWLKVSWRRTE